MSAARLREAAALMRERAEAARSGIWYADGRDVLAAWSQPRPITTCDGSPVPMGNYHNAEHIASWHPAVALAVADWLEAQASTFSAARFRAFDEELHAAALAVVDAYLGAS